MTFLLAIIAASALGIIYWAGYFIRSEVRRYDASGCEPCWEILSERRETG